MIRLLLVDDRELVCQGLKAMLNLESDLEVVGVANNEIQNILHELSVSRTKLKLNLYNK